MKNKILSRLVLTAVLLATTLALAAPKPPKVNSPQNVPPFPGTLVNARYVYVTSYDGDQFDINLLPEDRQCRPSSALFHQYLPVTIDSIT